MSIQEHLNKIRNAIKGSEVRESIAKGIETAYDDASEKDNANMEVKIARGTHPNLRSRLEEIDNKQQQTTAQLAQTEHELIQKVGNGKLASMDDMGQDVKEAITGGSVGVVGKNSVIGHEDIVPASITLAELTVEGGYLPKSVRFQRNGDNGVISSELVLTDKVVIKSLTSNITFIIDINRNDGNGFARAHNGWLNEFPIVETATYQIRARFLDSSDINGNFSVFTNNIQILDGTEALRKNEFNKFKENDLGGILPPPLINQSMDFTTGLPHVEVTPVRLSTTNLIDFPMGSVVKLKDTDNFDMGVWSQNKGGLLSGWDSIEYTADVDDVIALSFKRDDNSALTPSDLQDKFVVKTPHRFVQYSEIGVGHSTGEIVKYVTLTGNDNNNGNNISQAYETLQRALDEGATKILIERGIYYQGAKKENASKLKILPLSSGVYNGQPNQPVEFRGSVLLSNWTSYNNIYKTLYDGNPSWQSVFIDQTVAIENGISYNAGLWEGNNGVTDYLMKPVLTLEECELQKGTFFFNGSEVYVNPNDINSEFNAVHLDDVIQLSGDDITIQDFKAGFSRYSPLNLDNIKKLKVQNVEGHHSYLSDGISLDYTNGVLNHSGGVKNINDGFNMHFYGDTQLNNCYGINNYDDGISHHEHCTGVINGGVWKGNGKAGVAPVNYAQVNVYNALIEGNGHGIYNVGIDNTVTNISQGNVFKDNNVRFRNSNAVLLSINDTSINNGSDKGQTPVTEY